MKRSFKHNNNKKNNFSTECHVQNIFLKPNSTLNDSYKHQLTLPVCKSVQNQAVLLMGTPSRSSLSSVMYYSNVLNIPYLTSSPPLFEYPYDMKHSTLFLRPPILPSLHALLDFFGWKSIFYIFNHDDGEFCFDDTFWVSFSITSINKINCKVNFVLIRSVV